MSALNGCLHHLYDLTPEARFRVLSAVAIAFPLANDIDPSMRVVAAAQMLEHALDSARKDVP